jgi:hypothetical protein
MDIHKLLPMTLKKILPAVLIFLLLTMSCQAAIVFSTTAAAKIVVMKVLSISPQGSALITAYSWATNPEASAIGALDPTGITYSALKVVQGVDPLQLLGGMAMDKAQNEVLGKIYESLPPEQQIAFSNAQEYASYAQQVFKYKPDSDELKKLMEKVEYSPEEMKLKMPDGKGGYKDFMTIPKGWKMQAEKEITTLTASDSVQEFRFKEDVSAYLQKGGIVKIEGDMLAEIDATTSKESRLNLNGREFVVPDNTAIKYKDGKLMFPEKGISIIVNNENIYLTGENAVFDTNLGRLEGKGFKLRGIEFNGDYCRIAHAYGSKKPGITGDLIRITKEETPGEPAEPIKTEPIISKPAEILPVKSCTEGNAFIEFSGKGIILKNGAADKDKLRIYAKSSENIDVLIADSDADVSNYKGNWIKNSENSLESKSAEGSRFDFDVLPGNKLFNTFTREYSKDTMNNLVKYKSSDGTDFLKDDYGYKYRIVPNENILLEFQVAEGDGISAKSRTDNVPEVIHIHLAGSKGYSILRNGKNEFTLGDELRVLKPLEKDMYKYDSASLELNSPSLSGSLKIGSNNQYSIYDGKNTRLFSKGIPVFGSSVGTLDELRAKWGGKIEFGFSTEEEGEFKKDENYKRVSPNLLQAVDYWLETHPEAAKNIKGIIFYDGDNAAYTGEDKIILGEKIFDSDFLDKLSENQKDRNFNDALATITHEYEHLLDSKVRVKEDLPLKIVVNKLRDETKMAQLRERASEEINKESIEVSPFYFSVHILGPVDLYKKGSKYYRDRVRAFEEFGYDAYRVQIKDADITNEEIDERVKMDREELSLKNKYLEINQYFLSEREKLGGEENSESWQIATQKVLENKDYYDFAVNEKYKSDINNKADNYLYEEAFKNPETMPLDIVYRNIATSRKEKFTSSEEYSALMNEGISLLKREGSKIISADPKKGYQLYNIISEYDKNPESAADLIPAFGLFSGDSDDIKIFNEKLSSKFQEQTGLSAGYALKTYYIAWNDVLSEIFGGYRPNELGAEVSTTYREEPIEERKQKANSENIDIRDTYRLLTQVAFDAGKMPVEEYKEIMGEDYCKEPDCCDKKCINYKLTCKGKC